MSPPDDFTPGPNEPASLTGGANGATLCEGRYRLDRVIGEGGMAKVYRGFDTRLKVERAIKVLNPNLDNKQRMRQRFEEEAQTMARLHHPRIVTVHDVGADRGQSYIVMELLPGGSLMDRLQREGPVGPRAAAHIMREVLTALHHAHENGVIHRDMKPHNVLLDRAGLPKVTDFGIARMMHREQALTRTGTQMGTLPYMAPEMISDATQASVFSDIYAASVTLLEILTARRPEPLYADSIHGKVFAGIPPALAQVIMRGGRYEPGDRYPTAKAMAEALEEAATQLPLADVAALRVPAPEPVEVQGEPAVPAPSRPAAAPSKSGPTLEPLSVSAGTRDSVLGTNAGGSTFSLGDGDAESFMAPAAEAPRLRRAGVLAAVFGAVAVVGGGYWWSTGGESAPESPTIPVNAAPEPAPVMEPVAKPGMPEAPVAVEAAPAVPPAPKPTPPPAPAPRQLDIVKKPGQLLVNSDPAGRVSIDGGAPIDLPIPGMELPGGTHKLVFTDAEGRHGSMSVTVTADAPTKACWDFEAGTRC